MCDRALGVRCERYTTAVTHPIEQREGTTRGEAGPAVESLAPRVSADHLEHGADAARAAG